MGYWGTVVVARPHGLLVDQEGVAGFGNRHLWLRELSDGWQLLETAGFNDPPDLLSPCEAVVASTGYPVLAAYISDSCCAAMCVAIPGRVGPLTHLWDVRRTCGVYRHQPSSMAPPVGRSLDEVVAELATWSTVAGLRADLGRLRAVVGRDDDETYSQVDDLMFELVKALGLTRIGQTRPWSLPAYDWPFCGVMFSLGPAFQARVEAKYRVAGAKAMRLPAQPWEAPALALEKELWASLYRPGVEVAALARRAAFLIAAYQAVPTAEEPITATAVTDTPVLDEAALDLLAALESRLASGIVPCWSEEFEARQHADARTTESKTRDCGTQD